MKFQRLLLEMELISDKQTDVIRQASAVQPVKAVNPAALQVLKKIKYPTSDKSKLKLEIDEDHEQYVLYDSKMWYELRKIGNAYDISFGLMKGHDSFKLKSIVPKETIFTNLKTVIYIVLSFTNKKNLVCTFKAALSDKDGEIIDNNTLLYLTFTPEFQKLAKIYKPKNHISLYAMFNDMFLDKYKQGKNLTPDLNNFFNELPDKAQKYKQPIIDWFNKARKDLKIASIRSKMYIGLLNKLGKNVKYNNDKEEYSFTVSKSDLT